MFKNAIFYRLEGFEHSADALLETLKGRPFEPCGKFQFSSVGWVSPAGGDADYLRTGSGAHLMSLCFETKSIPAGVVEIRLQERIEEHEQKHGEPPSKKDIKDIKDDIKLKLVPFAFPKRDVVNLLIATDGSWLLVDASSASKAEKVLKVLRQDLGSLKAFPYEIGRSPLVVMTQWLEQREAPEKVSLPGYCVLVSEDAESVVCKNMDLFSDEIGHHLDTGKKVESLTLNHDSRLTFSLDKNLIVKGLSFDKSLEPEEDEMEEDEDKKQSYLIDGWLASLVPEFNAVRGFMIEQFDLS